MREHNVQERGTTGHGKQEQRLLDNWQNDIEKQLGAFPLVRQYFCFWAILFQVSFVKVYFNLCEALSHQFCVGSLEATGSHFQGIYLATVKSKYFPESQQCWLDE
ncbi:hypothetical protein Patl1_25146 [Pistacia atlantica]|uniref:Uncharacterized protein n=1 Tax=Pistacia atlantica TaxID=434234 RepID=A0ACC1B0S5_9ROSI|nr:hypothetical protein Patl1_25146 [Pistacia atlantica]